MKFIIEPVRTRHTFDVYFDYIRVYRYETALVIKNENPAAYEANKTYIDLIIGE